MTGIPVSRTLWSPWLLLVLLAPGLAQAAWYDGAWVYRLRLTADPALIADGETFSDFTLHLKLSAAQHATVFAQASTNGSDLVLTAADGTTVLGHELVSYNAGAQTGELWFKAPSLSDTQNVFYLYFGNPAANTLPSEGLAWTSGHIGVFHFEQDPSLGQLEDYGPHDNDATTGGSTGWTSGARVDGPVGKGWNYNGQDTFVDGDAVQSNYQSYTISAWFALSSLGNDANFAFSSEGGFWHLSAKRNGEQVYPDIATGGGFIRWNPLIMDNDPHYYVWTLDAVADTARFYFDGVEQGFNVRFAPNPPYKVYTGLPISGHIGIGGPLFTNNPFDLMEGVTDEFRIYEGIRSPAWIATEYASMAQADTFFDVELEQPTSTDPLRPLLARLHVWPNPFAGRAQIDVEGHGDALEVAVYDLAGRRVRTLRAAAPIVGPSRLIWDGKDDEGLDVATGTYFVRAIEGTRSASAKLLLLR